MAAKSIQRLWVLMVVPLQEAATRLGKDPRTVIRAITSGEIHGGAMPRPERLRWYVYADALPGETPTAPAVVADAVVEDLRALIVSLSEANRLLIAAQRELLDVDRATNNAAEKYRAVARNYLDALGQFMTPPTWAISPISEQTSGIGRPARWVPGILSAAM